MRRPRLRWARRAATVVVFALAVEYLVLPQIPGTRSALHLLGGVQPLWLVLGVGLEAASLVSFALVASIPFVGVHAVYIWTTAVAAVVIAVSVAAIVALTRGSVRTRTVPRRLVAALPRRWQPRVQRAVDTATTQILHLLANRHGLKRGTVGPP